MLWAIWELIGSGIVWQVSKAERRSSVFPEHISVMNHSIIKERNYVSSCVNYQRNARSIHHQIGGDFLFWVQSSNAVGPKWERQCNGRENRIIKSFRQTLTKAYLPITFFDNDIIGWRLPSVLDREGNYIVQQMFTWNLNGSIYIGSIAQG